MTEPTEKRKLNVIAVLTAVVVIGYVVASIVAVYQKQIDFKEFSAAIGPLAGMLIAWWLRDQKE